jgi:nitrite reductase (NADH) small subunit
MDWIEIGSISDIPRRGARCVVTPHGRIAVFRTQDDQIFAMEDRCPHRNGPLSQGIVHGTSVTCPLHNWVISLESGAAQGADEGRTRTFATRRDGERILVEASIIAAADRAAAE